MFGRKRDVEALTCAGCGLLPVTAMGWIAWLWCQRCGVYGPTRYGERWATRAWNRKQRRARGHWKDSVEHRLDKAKWTARNIERLEARVSRQEIVACAVCGQLDFLRSMRAVSYPLHPRVGEVMDEGHAHAGCIAGSKYDRREAPREDKAEAEG